ncbi:hypothetical protein [Streptomyces malaysiense]|uniref:Uncharacterized protein n=1 Tax=Streptomyces malaysiense TaxID=1428626 RepID=A0A1J4Q3Q2_9ACTN|nr:hypothetical protein [Streptomyces malaysiense]OIK26720.1 hypothetical protein VT52_014600 [Streptomyces malaysiense]
MSLLHQRDQALVAARLPAVSLGDRVDLVPGSLEAVPVGAVFPDVVAELDAELGVVGPRPVAEGVVVTP